jgi:chemotaxis methyl-accepting protein methylase
MMHDITDILHYLKAQRGFDFSGYRLQMLDRRIRQRLAATNCGHYRDYLACLRATPKEMDHLVDTLTINVSRFFRNALTFEYIADKILPQLFHAGKDRVDHSLRIWSAGCARGEEPYSLAILLHDMLQKEDDSCLLDIFATDIDVNVLQKAKKAVYGAQRIQSVKYRHFIRYFKAQGDTYRLSSDIRQMVAFSFYDMLDNKSYAPPESIYGQFDMVLCRNVLIYYDVAYQNLIFEKLYRSLSRHGYLILGKSETPSSGYQERFKRVTSCGHIYRKL